MPLIGTLGFILDHPLNRNDKRRALLRYLRWQIGSRVLPGRVIMEWVGGTRVTVGPGDSGFTQNIYCGLQDFADMAYLLHSVTPQDLFVDVGANIGAYTVLACGVKGARGYCFEPIPSTFSRLAENVLINGLSDRVNCSNIGISDTEGQVRFTSGKGPMNHVIALGEDVEDGVTVPVSTLDRILAGESPSLLKIDVEGFETAVLDGAEAVLSNPSLHSIIVELNESGSSRYGFSEQTVLRKLNDFGFSLYAYDPFCRTLNPLNVSDVNCNNGLFVRNSDNIQERLQRAPRFAVHSVEF